MLFDLTFPCCLTTFSGKKCLSGKVICVFFWPAYRSSPVGKEKADSKPAPNLLDFGAALGGESKPAPSLGGGFKFGTTSSKEGAGGGSAIFNFGAPPAGQPSLFGASAKPPGEHSS
jgi:hypothetical protein